MTANGLIAERGVASDSIRTFSICDTRKTARQSQKEKHAGPILMENMRSEIAKATGWIADGYTLRRDLIKNDEVIAIILQAVSDRGQGDLPQRLHSRSHSSGLKTNLFGCKTEARHAGALTIRAGQFAQESDRYRLLVVRTDHREGGRAAVCRIMLVNDWEPHNAPGYASEGPSGNQRT